MPINKDSLKRYRIEDELLCDGNYNYTTEMIRDKVNAKLPYEDRVSLRMIQKDIKSLEENFGKEMERNRGGRGTVKYKDQSSPLFSQQLTIDEERLLREVMKTLGQFSGLDNFTWLDRLKKKLDMDGIGDSSQPVISFSRNEGLQVPETLLGRLFTAISRKQVIRVSYKKFGAETKEYDVYPYQLKQYNDRWFLLATPLADDIYPYNPEFIVNLALDRILDFTFIEDRGDYVETCVDLKAMYDEVVGVTLDSRYPDPEDICFAVKPASVDYIRTKWIHSSQMEIKGESAEHIRKCYPSLRDCTFFSICCRMNPELLSKFLSYGENLIVFDDPKSLSAPGDEKPMIASSVMAKAAAVAENYRKLAEDIERNFRT